MPLKSLTAQAASLDNDYGSTRGPNAPASLIFRIFVGDPMGDGVEMPATTDIDGVPTANGYAPVTVPNDDATWLPADVTDGSKATNPLTFPTSLAPYPEIGTHMQVEDAATGAVWDCVALAATDRVVVAAAGVAPRPIFTVFYNDKAE